MSHDYDSTLTFLLESYRPQDVTLKLYVATAWMGDMSIEDICESPELVAEIPKSLIRKFLKSDDVDEVSLDGLLSLVELAAEEEEEDEDEEEEEEEEEEEKKEKEQEEEDEEDEEDEEAE